MANKYNCPEIANGVFLPPLVQFFDARPKERGKLLKVIDSPVTMSERERLGLDNERYYRETEL